MTEKQGLELLGNTKKYGFNTFIYGLNTLKYGRGFYKVFRNTVVASEIRSCKPENTVVA